MSEANNRRRGTRNRTARTSGGGPRPFDMPARIISYHNKGGGFVSKQKSDEENAKAAYALVEVIADLPEYGLSKGDQVKAFTALPNRFTDGKWKEISATDYKNRSVEGLSVAKGNGRGAGAPMEAGAIVSLEKCRVVDGNILCNYTGGGLNADDISLNVGEERGGEYEVGRVYAGVSATVFPENYRLVDDENGTYTNSKTGKKAVRKYQQKVHIYAPESAVEVKSEKDVVDVLTNVLADDFTLKGVTLLGYRIADAETGQSEAELGLSSDNRLSCTLMVYPSYETNAEGETEQRIDPQSAIDTLKERAEAEPDSMAADVYANLNNPEWKFIAVPVDEVLVAKSRLPSGQAERNKERLAKGDKEMFINDISSQFMIYEPALDAEGEIDPSGKMERTEVGVQTEVTVFVNKGRTWFKNDPNGGEPTPMDNANAYGIVLDPKTGNIKEKGDFLDVGTIGYASNVFLPVAGRTGHLTYIPELQTPLTPESHIAGIEAERKRLLANETKVYEAAQAERKAEREKGQENKEETPAPSSPSPGM